MWQPDGWEVRTRIGVLTPHADVGPESEIRAMAPETVGVHAARVPFGAMATGGAMDPTIPLAPIAAFVEPPHIDDAVSLLAAAPLAVIGIGFTSSAYVTGTPKRTWSTDSRAAVPAYRSSPPALPLFKRFAASEPAGSPSSIPPGSTRSSTDSVPSTSHRRVSRWSSMHRVVSRATSGASIHVSSMTGSSRIRPTPLRRCSWVATAFGVSASSLHWRRPWRGPC